MPRSNVAVIRIVGQTEGFSGVARQIHGTTTALNQASGAARNYDREAKGAAEASSNSTKEFSKMAQGIGGLVHTYAIFAANIFAVTAAFRALSEAADFQRMINASKQLSVQTGQNFYATALAMKEVSAGALDMRAAMQSANLGLSAGFTTDQMAKLTKLATQAGTALGRNIPDAINRLVTAVVKGEPELTDELGIILRLKEATEDYAQSIGKLSKDLTTAERLQAVYAQAIERGTPKYGEIDVETQPFTKLASTLQDVIKDMLNFSNTLLGPVAEAISKSKGLITLLILAFSSILLKQSSKSLGAGFATGLEKANVSILRTTESLKRMKRETQEIAKLNAYRQRDPDDFKYGGIPRGNAISLGDAFSAAQKKKLSKDMKKIFKGGDVEEMGKQLASSIGTGLLKELPLQIEKAVKRGKTGINFKDIYGDEQVIQFKRSEDLAEFGEALNNERIFQEARVRNARDERIGANLLGQAYLRLETIFGRFGATYTRTTTVMRSASARGFGAAIDGTRRYRFQLARLNRDLRGSTAAVQIFSRALFRTSYAFGGAAQGFNLLVGAASKLLGIFSAIGIVWEVFKGITGFNFDNWNSAKEATKQVSENLKVAGEAAATVTFNVKNMTEYKEELKKTVHIGRQYASEIGNVGKILDDMEKANIISKLFDDGDTVNENIDNTVRGYGELISLMQQTPEGLKQAQELTRSLTGETIKFTKKYEDRQASIDAVQEKLNKDTASRNRNIAKGNTEMAAMLQRRINFYTLELQKLKEFTGGLTKAASTQFTLNQILGEQADIGKILSAGNKEDLHALREKVVEAQKLTGITDIQKQLFEGIKVAIDAALGGLESMTAELESMSNVLDRVLKQYLTFSGSQSAVKIAELQEKMIENEQKLKGIEGKGAETNQETRDRLKAENLIAEAEIKREETRERARQKLEAIAFNQSVTHVDELHEKEYKSMKEINNAKMKNEKALIENAVKRADIESSIVASQREVESAGDNKLKKAKAQRRLEAAEREKSRVDAQRSRLEENKRILEQQKAKEKPQGGGSGGSKAATVTKASGVEAQIELEKLKAIEAVYTATSKNQLSSLKDRANAMEQLYGMEVKMHSVRLSVIQGNIDDAELNVKNAKNTEDALKHELTLQKARAQYMIESANQAQRLYELTKAVHEAQKQGSKEGMSLSNFSTLFLKDIQYAAKELRDALVDPITMLTTALVDTFKTGADALADAVVENDFSNIREKLSDSLKTSAKNLISSGIQGLLTNFIGTDLLAGTAKDELTALNRMDVTLAKMLKIMEQQEITGAGGLGSALAGMLGDSSKSNSGGTDSLSFLGSGLAALKSIFFANGGIIDHVGKYASGHVTRGPELAVIGEGKKREAVVPLPDNKSIPVKLSGNSGATNSNVYVTVNRDGSSSTNTESDAQEAKALGELINKSVQRIIVQERRVGGLLGAS